MKDYDSTLARMAGNIAAGLVMLTGDGAFTQGGQEELAEASLSIAKRIISKAKTDYTLHPPSQS